MRQVEDRRQFARVDRTAPHWSAVLRALREAAGVTQEGWAARLGYGRRTIQRWEHAELPPDARAAEALTHLSARLGLFREYQHGPLAGRAVTAEWLIALLSDARVRDLGTRVQPGALTELAPSRSSLPAPLTTFVGRERERTAISHVLGTTRLLTLTGAGGVGKTRLALEVARDNAADFGDGVWLVDLAALSDPRLVPQAVAGVLGVREQPDRSLVATLTNALRGRTILIILDSCEHVAEGCVALVATLLSGCPDLRFLATSRVVLGVSGELSWSVPPLATPDLTHEVTAEVVAQSDAGQLFVQRARAVAPGFILTEETSKPIAELCARLDGLPLAIELAAAWMRVLSPMELARRLGEPFGLLIRTAQDAPARQRTLRATLDWSYRLLADPEQRLLARLSVFAGGATLAAIETVGREDAEFGSPVLQNLARLVDASLVQRLEGSGDEPRFRLLETVRQYAHEQLAAQGDVDDVARRHAIIYRDLAEAAQPQLRGPDSVPWLDRLERDHDNLRTALHWAIARQEGDLSERLAAGLGLFWYRRGHIQEGRALLDAVLALPTATGELAVRVQLLQAGALLALHHGDYRAARGAAEEGVALARQLARERSLVEILGVLGFIARIQEDWATARQALEECLALARVVGHRFGTAMSLHHLGLLAFESERDVATAWSLNEESLTLARSIGDRRLEANVLGARGRVARARGDQATACGLLAAALTAYGEVGDLGTIPHVLYTRAAIAADAGQLERAVRLAGAAARITELVGSQEWPTILRERDGWLGAARGTLGDPSFARAWAEGQATTLELTITRALAEAMDA